MARCRFDRVERRPRCVDHQLAPWKVTARWRCPVINGFVSSLSPPVTSHQNQTLRRLPRGRSRPVLPFFAQQPSDADSNEPETSSSVDETFGGEECAAENCEPRENTWRDRARNTFSPRRRRMRVAKFHSPHRSRGKRLNLRTFGRSHSCRTMGGRCPKKISTRRRQMQDFRVALVTMMLTHCRTCAFRARFFYVAFHLGPWLKGFCAVA